MNIAVMTNDGFTICVDDGTGRGDDDETGGCHGRLLARPPLVLDLSAAADGQTIRLVPCCSSFKKKSRRVFLKRPY